jgi:hypothetical protein
MSAPVALNSLITKATSVLTSSGDDPEKGLPQFDKMSYAIIGQYMHIYWHFKEGSTPSAAAFTVDETTDIFTAVAHGFYTGQVVQVSTDDELPAPLEVSTNYYVIKIDDDTFYLASSLDSAFFGYAMDITTAGAGTNEATPEDASGSAGTGNYLLEMPDSYEIDGSFVNIGTGAHDSNVGRLVIMDNAGTCVYGHITAYSASLLGLVAGDDFVSATNYEIDSADKPVSYSVHAIVPIKNRNYLY